MKRCSILPAAIALTLFTLLFAACDPPISDGSPTAVTATASDVSPSASPSPVVVSHTPTVTPSPALTIIPLPSRTPSPTQTAPVVPPTPTQEIGIADTPTRAPSLTPRPTPAPTISPVERVRVNVGTLFIRAAPSINAERIDSLRAGDVVTIEPGHVDADGYRWRKLDCCDEWIAERFLGGGAPYLVTLE